MTDDPGMPGQADASQGRADTRRGRVGAWFRRVGARIRGLPPLLLVLLVAGTTVLLVWGGVEAYRTYDYVQHDNDFCLSCHLMVDPYERFAQSSHRDLGCKACHRPTLVTRSTMALTQILQDPDSLTAHAEVPNAVCIECHVDGDPDEWSNIAASAGHRVHFESDDPGLSDLKCVECHASSVHEFSTTDQTCGQAGCHENQDIQLGAMGALTIHCASCHVFNAEVHSESADSVQLALQPQRGECLGCHAMQERMASFPMAEDDAHDGLCGACHNPHDQAVPREAFETCTTCHTSPETLTPLHRGLAAGVLQECSSCHTAHTFHQDGAACLDCHTDPAQPGRVTPPVPAGHPTRTSAGDVISSLLRAVLLPAPAHAQQARPQGFDHARHTDIECVACHSVDQTHGRVTVSAPADCFACHHRTAVAQPCTACHESAEVAARAYAVRRPYRPSVGTAENRTFTFDHAPHAQTACVTCHIEGVELSAARVNCSACHTEHHDAGSNCAACHETPSPTAHTTAAHLTCTGAGCHSPSPVVASDRTRELCLTCHRTMTDHFPGRRCIDCHALPDARTAAAVSDETPAHGALMVSLRAGALGTAIERLRHRMLDSPE